MLSILFESESRPVANARLLDRFDDVLSQTNHSVLIALCEGRAIATLSVTIVDAIAPGYPKAYLSCFGTLNSKAAPEAREALLEAACKIALEHGCTRIKRAVGSYACKRVL